MAEPILTVAGTTGLKQWSGYVDEEQHKDLKGGQGARVFSEMGSNDPVCHAYLLALEMLCRQVPFTFNAVDKRPEAKQVADFVTSCWEDMESTPTEAISEIISFAQYGWSLCETNYKIRRGKSPFGQFNSRYNDGKIGWRDHSIRSQDSLQWWDFADNGRVLAMWQSAAPDFRLRKIPIDKSLLFRVRTRKNNPEGISLIRGAYVPYYFVKRLREIEAIGVERDLAGLPVMQLPVEFMRARPTADQLRTRQAYEKLVSRVRMDRYHGLVIPSETMPDGTQSGYKLSLLTSGGRRPVDVNEIIKRYESRILVSVLAELLLLGMDKVGSWALSDSKTEMLALSLNAILSSITDVFNRHAIPRLCRLNNIPEELFPVMAHGEIERPDVQQFGAALAQLISAGALVPDDSLETFIRETFGLPVKDAGAPEAGQRPTVPELQKRSWFAKTWSRLRRAA